jgi:hypothetical protein
MGPMRRHIGLRLQEWRDSSRRKPLIVRGARQVGKTDSVRQFGREHFGQIAAIDLERNRNLHTIFSGDLNAKRILAPRANVSERDPVGYGSHCGKTDFAGQLRLSASPTAISFQGAV